MIFWLGFLGLAYCKILVLKSNQSYSDRLSSFGPRLSPQEGLLGVLRDIGQGCDPSPFVNTSWIALVERGGCSFVEKIRSMQLSGASAVIVGNNEATGGLITMFSR